VCVRTRHLTGVSRRWVSAALAGSVCMFLVASLLPGTGFTRPAGAAAKGGPGPAKAPLGTIGTAGRWPVDTAGRTILLHGLTLPVGTIANDAVATRLAAAGFDAVRMPVTYNAQGLIVGVAADGDVGGFDAPGDEVAAGVTVLYDHGVLTLLDLIPAGGGPVNPATLALAVGTISKRFANVTGVIGLEVTQPAGADPRALNAAVRRVDRFHLLWRDVPAPFDAAAGIAGNGAASILTGWADGTPATIAQLAATADTRQLGWIFDQPVVGAVGAALVRPFAAAVAGTPSASAFDPASRVYTLRYNTVTPGRRALPKGSTTQVTVPASVYPDGYTVTVTGATVRSQAGSGEVCLADDPGQATVTVRIAPAAEGAGVAVRPGRGLAGCPSGVVADTGDGIAGAGDPNAPAESVGVGATKHRAGWVLWAAPLGGAAAAALLIGGLMTMRRRRRVARAAAMNDDHTPYL
jgi:Glycoside hydrolase family 5 C-terminal domain